MNSGGVFQRYPGELCQVVVPNVGPRCQKLFPSGTCFSSSFLGGVTERISERFSIRFGNHRGSDAQPSTPGSALESTS